MFTKPNPEAKTSENKESEAKINKSKDTLNGYISSLYQTALSVPTKRTKLQNALSDLLQKDLNTFTQTAQELVKPTTKKIVIDNVKHKLGWFWRPGRVGNGSKLREEIEAKNRQVEKIKKDFSECEKLKPLVEELNKDSLTVKEFFALKAKIKDLPNSPKNNDLKYLCYYKQAEMLFTHYILPNQLGYQASAYSMEKVLMLLFCESDEVISEYLSGAKDLQGNYDTFLQEKIKQNKALIKTYFKKENAVVVYDVNGLILALSDKTPEHEEVIASFLQICKEWLQLGVIIGKDKTKDFQLETWLTFSKSLFKVFSDASNSNLSLNFDVTTGMKKYIEQTLAKAQEDLSLANMFSSLTETKAHAKDFLSYKISQYKSWLIDLAKKTDRYEESKLHEQVKDLKTEKCLLYVLNPAEIIQQAKDEAQEQAKKSLRQHR